MSDLTEEQERAIQRVAEQIGATFSEFADEIAKATASVIEHIEEANRLAQQETQTMTIRLIENHRVWKVSDKWNIFFSCPSSSGGKPYTVSAHKEITLDHLSGFSEWACSCPAWTRHMPRMDCKHIEAVQTSLIRGNVAGYPEEWTTTYRKHEPESASPDKDRGDGEFQFENIEL